MAIYGSFAVDQLFAEVGVVHGDYGTGTILTPAQQRQKALRNLTGDANITVANLTALSGSTPGSVVASKVVTVDANRDIVNFRNVSATGIVTATGGIAAAGGFSVSPRVFHSGGNPAIATADGTNAAAVTTESYRVEIFVPANTTSTGVAVFNGTAVAGNLQAYLVDSTGAQIAGAVTLSTAAAGTTVYQRIPWNPGTVALKGPATYWVVIQSNNAGYNFRFHAVGSFGADKQTSTVFGTLTVAAAPTTFNAGQGPICSLY